MPTEQAVDMLNDTLKEIVFRTKNQNKFKRLARTTHFNFREVEALAIIHRKCIEAQGPMSRLTFRDLFHSGFDFTENIRHLLIDRIFSLFDKRNALQIHFDQWIEGLSVIFRGTLDEKINFAYMDLIDLLMKKLDVDRDGTISEEDFKTAVKERNELLLECMGPVFPSREARHAFLRTFTDQLGRY
ncbi:clxn [Anthophora plagiata]